jgi:hypothetical protein
LLLRNQVNLAGSETQRYGTWLAAATGSVGQWTTVAEGQVDQGTPAEQPIEGTDRPLVASPSRLIIPAGSRRDVPVVYHGGRLSERYFRLRLCR